MAWFVCLPCWERGVPRKVLGKGSGSPTVGGLLLDVQGLFVLSPISGFSGPPLLLCNRVVVGTIIRIASISAAQSAVCGLAASPGSLLGTQVPWLRPDLPKWSLWAWGAAICFNSLPGESEVR